MLRTSPNQLAENLLLSMDGAKDAEISSGTSFIIRLAEKLSVSSDMAEDAKVNSNKNGDDKTVKHTYGLEGFLSMAIYQIITLIFQFSFFNSLLG